jgi:hypothetical protein
MKKQILAAALVLAAVYSSLAAEPASPAAGAPRIKLAQATVNAPLPDGVPFEVKPSHVGQNAGYVLTYLVQGKGLTHIDASSFKVATATAGGADIASTASGRPSCRVSTAPAPRVASGGEWGTFSIEINPEGGVKGVVPTVHGTIDVVCSTGVDEQTLTLDVAQGSTVSTVGLVFKSTTAQGFFGGESYGIQVAGDLSALASLEVVDGGKTLKSNAHMTMGGTTTYQYPQPTSSSLTLKISVNQGTSRQTIRF